MKSIALLGLKSAPMIICQSRLMTELIARIRAIIRRSNLTTQEIHAAPAQEFGDLRLDPSRQEVYCNEQLILLTGTEFTLLHTLALHAGELMNKEELNEKVLGKNSCPSIAA